MSGDEVEEWKAYFNKRPFTQDLLDFGLAQITLVIARTMGGAKNAKLKDFLLINRKHKKSVQQMEAEFRAMTS